MIDFYFIFIYVQKDFLRRRLTLIVLILCGTSLNHFEQTGNNFPLKIYYFL